MAANESQLPQGPNPKAAPTPGAWERHMPFDVQTTLERLKTLDKMGTPEEHRETWEYLKKALDEDRPTGRKLFPKE